ncbi:MAG: glycerol-3-phosphate acyltransferase, partial [Flavobacteriales bacterium]
ILFLLTRYVSLGAIVSAICFPFLIMFVFQPPTSSLIYFSIACAALILLTHQKNIERLLNKEENKIRLNTKKNENREE